ncbi:hypothetical protein CL622_02560 [archaeon]|nr:hypothetical protein [archaeon]|tara:strand:- start:379 stop:708 length:330 start_codon:yes stop_codon:yes gene_type:complete
MNHIYGLSGELTIGLTINEALTSAETELIISGEETGKRLKTTYDYNDHSREGDGIKVDFDRLEEKVGWDSITAIKVTYNRMAYNHSVIHGLVGSRYDNQKEITIYLDED